MKEDFSELVEYLDQRFGGLEAEIKEIKSTLNTLLGSIDKLVGFIVRPIIRNKLRLDQK